MTEQAHPSLQYEPQRRGNNATFESDQSKLSASDSDGVLGSLTPRQADVLSLMARGLTNRAIAERLSISEKSVENYVNAIYQVLGVRAAGSVHPRVSAVLSFLTQPDN